MEQAFLWQPGIITFTRDEGRRNADTRPMADEHSDDTDAGGSDDANIVTAYTWAVVLAQTLLDSPRQMRLFSGRHAPPVIRRLLQQCLAFEDVPELVEELEKREVRQHGILRWLESVDDTDTDEEIMEERCADTLWIVLPMLQLEILQRREAAFFDAKFDVPELALIGEPNTDGGERHDLVDISEDASDDASDDASQPAGLLTVPLELLTVILRRSRREAASK